MRAATGTRAPRAAPRRSPPRRTTGGRRRADGGEHPTRPQAGRLGRPRPRLQGPDRRPAGGRDPARREPGLHRRAGPARGAHEDRLGAQPVGRAGAARGRRRTAPLPAERQPAHRALVHHLRARSLRLARARRGPAAAAGRLTGPRATSAAPARLNGRMRSRIAAGIVVAVALAAAPARADTALSPVVIERSTERLSVQALFDRPRADEFAAITSTDFGESYRLRRIGRAGTGFGPAVDITPAVPAGRQLQTFAIAYNRRRAEYLEVFGTGTT